MNTRKGIMVVTLLAFLLAGTGCSKGPDSAVIARVNRAKITAADFKRQIEGLDNFQMEQSVASDPKSRKEFLDDLIGIEVVLQEARRQGLDKDPDFKKRQEMLKKEMERRVQDDYRNELFNSLLKKELSDKLNKVAQPTDDEVKDYYNKNADKMRTPDGKKLAFKDVEPQLKRRLLAEKQRDLYLEYAKALRAKATITVDEKALDEAAASLQRPAATGGLEQQKAGPAKEESKQK
ncbi:MAG TPA: SurA N-terminal domain-containing protein [Nitrospirota bacterium]|nr:SurA N-terminal domain-containing protein [Nitrospirota bacterium]